MTIHYALPFNADVIVAPGPWWLSSLDYRCNADAAVATFADPCEGGASFSVNDEDGTRLFEIELESWT